MEISFRSPLCLMLSYGWMCYFVDHALAHQGWCSEFWNCKNILIIMYWKDRTERPLLGVRWLGLLQLQHQQWSRSSTKTKIHTWQSCNMTNHDDALYKYTRLQPLDDMIWTHASYEQTDVTIMVHHECVECCSGTSRYLRGEYVAGCVYGELEWLPLSPTSSLWLDS